jgi:Na+/H+-dicarboxylate symporter
MLTMVLTQVGLPIKGIAIILGVDRLMDMLRTAVNITADATVAKGEGKVDMDIVNNLHPCTSGEGEAHLLDHAIALTG